MPVVSFFRSFSFGVLHLFTVPRHKVRPCSAFRNFSNVPVLPVCRRFHIPWVCFFLHRVFASLHSSSGRVSVPTVPTKSPLPPVPFFGSWDRRERCILCADMPRPVVGRWKGRRDLGSSGIRSRLVILLPFYATKAQRFLNPLVLPLMLAEVFSLECGVENCTRASQKM